MTSTIDWLLAHRKARWTLYLGFAWLVGSTTLGLWAEVLIVTGGACP